MVTLELLGPLIVEERLRQAERRYIRSTCTEDPHLLTRLIGATGSGLIGLGCSLQSIAKRPCPDTSVTRIELVADCGC